MTSRPSDTYRERLRVPIRWWAQGTMLVAVVWLSVVVAITGPTPWIITGVAAAMVAVALYGYGDAQVVVADGWFRAGRARIEVVHLGSVEALDAEAARRIGGPDADARAYLLLRPYLRRAVKVQIADPADPTPYWLVSSRHPRALAEALNAARGATPGASEHAGK